MMDYSGYAHVEIYDDDVLSSSKVAKKPRKIFTDTDKKIKHYCQNTYCPEKPKKQYSFEELVQVESFLFCTTCSVEKKKNPPQLL